MYSQFNVASVRKTYLALAISLLVEQGKIGSLDDTISQYLDHLPEFTHDVTIHHLLTHTHGVMEREGKGSLFVNFPQVQAGLIEIQASQCYLKSFLDLLEKLIIHKTVFEPYGLVETGWRNTPNEQFIYNYYSHPENWVGPNDSIDGDQSNLFVSTRDLAKWGQLHFRKGVDSSGRQLLPRSVFERVTSLQTPESLPLHLPRNGCIWWLQHDTELNQIGERVPADSYQVLGITGCAVLVVPDYNVVAVRMYNQLADLGDYDYLEDIRTFGNMVCDAVRGGYLEEH